MFNLHKKFSRLLGKFDHYSASSKTALIVSLFIFASIPVTVIGLYGIRSSSPLAASGKPDQLKLLSKVPGSNQPVFSWSCYCYTTKYRVYLRADNNQFWSGQYWYKDVTTTTADWGGWKSNNYPAFPGFSSKNYFWIVGCTPGYGGCNNSDIASFTVDVTKPNPPFLTLQGPINPPFISLSWTSPYDNSGNNLRFVVYRSQNGGSPIWACETTLNTCSDSNWEGKVSTSYIVRAVDLANNVSDYSNPAPKDPLITPDKDYDFDGFNDSVERYLGTNVRNKCGLNAWPPDFNSDGKVNTIDQQLIGDNYTTRNLRYDLDLDGAVTILDITRFNTYIGKTC